MRGKIGRLLALVIAINAALAVVIVVLKRTIPSVGDPDSNEISLAAIGDGVTLKSQAASFRGGSVLAIAGGVVLDLREAMPSPEGVRLRLTSYMGGIKVLVPPSWDVDMDGIALIGAFQNGAEAEAPGSEPDMSVEGLSILGGVMVERAGEPDELAEVARRAVEGEEVI